MKSLRDNYSKNELTKEVLKGLAVGGVILSSFALPNLPQVLRLFGATNSRERYRIKRTILNLKKQKMVNIYERGGEDVMEVTEAGKKRILKYKLNEMGIKRPKKWDGFWRIIAFDVPEKYKKARNALSFKLQEMEFYHLQKSIYVCPFECKDEIDFIGKFFNVRKYMKYFVAKEIDGEEFLKKYYNL